MVESLEHTTLEKLTAYSGLEQGDTSMVQTTFDSGLCGNTNTMMVSVSST